MAFKFLTRLAHALRKNEITANQTDPQVSTAHASRTVFGVGALIDQRYRLDAEIGKGGMGIVYRAHDIPNDRDVALKIINFEEANTLSRQQFSREAQINSRLDHAHIVAVYETGTVDTGASEPSPFIVMELVRGTSLDEIRGFTYARIIDIGQQICDALEYAHSQGFVHRDLKPGNVLIEKRGFQTFAKLADFGLARPLGVANLPTESNLAGSIFYLAPEVIAGQPSDVRSDLYALGVMLYEMTTGRVPFSDFDKKNILAQHLGELVAPPSQSRVDVPPALEAIILRLLAKNPKERFISAQEVRHALGQVSIASLGRGNLPHVLADFSGCENEITQVSQLLEAGPLVTLLGDSEMLALAVGAQLTDEFPDGVWLVELGQVRDPTLVLQTAAAILNIQPDSRRPLTVSLIESLREKNLLLLLNHCDHLIGACEQLVETILSTCPEVRILVITQQPLNISAEKCYRAGAAAKLPAGREL